jgi:nitrite reductase/ring-hydroxylating ferredoxin subunit
LDDLRDPGSRAFTFGEFPQQFSMFVVRKGATVFAYANDCPHTHSPLDWVPDQFLDYSCAFIQCATHGAKFRMEDGYCIFGPCKGDALTRVSVVIRDGEVVIA